MVNFYSQTSGYLWYFCCVSHLYC